MIKFKSKERVNTSLGRVGGGGGIGRREKRKEGFPGKRHVTKPSGRRAPRVSSVAVSKGRGNIDRLGAGSAQGPGHGKPCMPYSVIQLLLLKHKEEDMAIFCSESEIIRFALQRIALDDMGTDWRSEQTQGDH